MAYYVTGDCHGAFDKIEYFIDRMKLTEEDTIIVLGDMGLFWRKDMKDTCAYITHYESTYETNLWFIDGNHENFNLLKQLPLDENGLGVCSKHIRYIPRGTILNIDEKKCLFMGGADSIDKFRRVEGLSWWKDETITKEDVDKVAAGHYDYVFTHCCPKSIFLKNAMYLITVANVNQKDVNHESEQRLDDLVKKISFKNFWFGHYHVDKELEGGYRTFFNTFEEIK